VAILLGSYERRLHGGLKGNDVIVGIVLEFPTFAYTCGACQRAKEIHFLGSLSSTAIFAVMSLIAECVRRVNEIRIENFLERPGAISVICLH